MSAAAGAAAAGHAAKIQAIKASGVILKVEPSEFRKVLGQNPHGLVVHAFGGFFGTSHKYLMSYQGLAFYTSDRDAISIPGTCQVVEAQRIWIPG